MSANPLVVKRWFKRFFLDHELRFAGGYALVAPAERGVDFDFVDHELRFAGGYALIAARK